jgi:uncharacterized protein (DUF952 family)
MNLIYHITTKNDWANAQSKGSYEAPALKEEGFIHCCEAAQVEHIKSKYYADTTDLVKLVIDTDKLKSQLVFEWSPSLEETFPHIYGPIDMDAVIAVEELS